jgi:uncharacterized membrane protein
MKPAPQASLMSLIQNRLLTGLLVVIPIGITLWIGNFIFTYLTDWGVKFIKWFFTLLPALRILSQPTSETLLGWTSEIWFLTIVRIVTLVIMIVVLFFIGELAKWTLGKRLITIAEWSMMKVPMLNTVYSTIQQIGQAIWAPDGGMFRQVVLIEYPRKGMWVIGFLTNENRFDWEIGTKTGEELYSVFLPTTPNPTSGFLLFVPKKDCILLNMDVTEGMRLVISGGAVVGQSQRNGNITVPPPHP